MKIHLASATLSDIRWAVDHGLADGVVTSPALLAAVLPGTDGRDVLADITRDIAIPVSVTAGSIDPADIYRDGRELAKIADNIVVQVPMVDDAVVAIRRLTAEGVRVSASLVFSAAQALLAAKAGAVAVVTPIDQLDALGQDTLGIVHEIRELFDRGDVECDVVTAFPRTASEFTACGLAGADAAALPLDQLRTFLVHPLTDRAIDRFLKELTTRPKPRIAPV
jgi:transaldolase